MCLQTTNPPQPGRIKSSMTSRAREGILPVYSAFLKPQLQSCMQLWEHHHKRDAEMLQGVQSRPQRSCEGWSTSALETGSRSWACSAWRRENSRETPEQLTVTKRRYTKYGEWRLTRAFRDRTKRNGFQPAQTLFILDTRKKFFIGRVVRHCHRSPRAVRAAPSLCNGL